LIFSNNTDTVSFLKDINEFAGSFDGSDTIARENFSVVKQGFINPSVELEYYSDTKKLWTAFKTGSTILIWMTTGK
jgi:hypothetical protein